MKSGGKGQHAWPWLVLLFVACAQAQDPAAADGGACPQLPDGTDLRWEYRAGADSDFCRAIRNSDGSEAFGLYIAAKSPFEPRRGDRAEAGSIDGRSMHWYRGELAGKPNVQVRETLIDVGNGKLAHIWLQANSSEQLKEALGQAEGLRFSSARLSSAR